MNGSARLKIHRKKTPTERSLLQLPPFCHSGQNNEYWKHDKRAVIKTTLHFFSPSKYFKVFNCPFSLKCKLKHVRGKGMERNHLC